MGCSNSARNCRGSLSAGSIGMCATGPGPGRIGVPEGRVSWWCWGSVRPPRSLALSALWCFGSLSLPSASGASRASASLSPDLLRAVLSNLGAEGKRGVRIRGVLPEPLCLPAAGDKAPSSPAALCQEVSALPWWLLGLVLACGATAGELSPLCCCVSRSSLLALIVAFGEQSSGGISRVATQSLRNSRG